ncbi:hypothetical protein C8Q73DRAFT_696286 [Cubamyces lactineus]|nr:hypothetical protein C8Q73DRAFT_696286 [Cubamyces lactineus]
MSGRSLRFAGTIKFRCRYLPQQSSVLVPTHAHFNMHYATTTIPDTVFYPTTGPLYRAPAIGTTYTPLGLRSCSTMRCTLTYPEDTFVACAGVAEAFGRVLGSHTKYLAGLWRDSLIFDLLWCTITTNPLVRQGCGDANAPSWSWAASRYLVCFRPYISYRNDGVAVPSPDWEELGEVVECSVTVEDRMLPFGRVTGGHLILRALLLGPYDAEWLLAQCQYEQGGRLLFDEELKTQREGEMSSDERLWIVPLLYTPFWEKSWFDPREYWWIYCLMIKPQTGQSNVTRASATPEETVYRRARNCEFHRRGAEDREFLVRSQVDALRNRVDGRWVFPRTDIRIV